LQPYNVITSSTSRSMHQITKKFAVLSQTKWGWSWRNLSKCSKRSNQHNILTSTKLTNYRSDGHWSVKPTLQVTINTVSAVVTSKLREQTLRFVKYACLYFIPLGPISRVRDLLQGFS